METHPIEYIDIPRATFCTPNVGSFGLTEEQAREQGFDVVVGKVHYGAVGAGTVYGDRGGMIKIIGDKKYGELIGGHIVGARATELIQELVNAKALEGGYHEVGAHHPRSPDAVRGRHGGRARGRRLADPRLSDGRATPSSRSSTTTSPRPRPTWRPSAAPACSARCRSGSRCCSPACARASSARSAAPPRSTPTARTSSAAPCSPGIQPLRWPDPFPPDAEWAMLVATYAKQIGRAVAFSLAAFRQAYAAGATSATATPCCSPPPPARCTRPRSTRAPTATRSAAAWRRRPTPPAPPGVLEVPAVQVGDRIFHGDRELEAAAAVLA